jgi:hypothetical protein
MKDFQTAAGTIQDVVVLLARLEKDIKSGELDPARIKNLRGELLRHERQEIDSFMERIDELMDFEPEQSMPLAPKPKTASK